MAKACCLGWIGAALENSLLQTPGPLGKILLVQITHSRIAKPTSMLERTGARTTLRSWAQSAMLTLQSVEHTATDEIPIYIHVPRIFCLVISAYINPCCCQFGFPLSEWSNNPCKFMPCLLWMHEQPWQCDPAPSGCPPGHLGLCPTDAFSQIWMIWIDMGAVPWVSITAKEQITQSNFHTGGSQAWCKYHHISF